MPPTQAYQGSVENPAGVCARLLLINHNGMRVMTPTPNEISAASTGDPPAFANMAFVGACREIRPPEMRTSSKGTRTETFMNIAFLEWSVAACNRSRFPLLATTIDLLRSLGTTDILVPSNAGLARA